MAQVNAIHKGETRGGFPTITLAHASGYRVVVSEYGGHILAWTHPNGAELLFLSERSQYAAGAPIRGGIPVVFPQFGKAGPLPPHGFARTRLWKVAREQVTESDAVSVTLRLSPEPDVHEMWPHAFVVELDIVLSDVLVTTMRVANGDAEPFEFFSALHTYFNIGDITRCSVRGLQGNRYVDFLRGRQPFHEERDLITFESAVDRAYSTSPETVLIDAPATGFQFSVTKQGFADTVVWNPWKEGNAAISDLGTDDYQRMVCVEAANALEPVTLAPGAVHTSAQVFRVVAAS